MTDTDENGVVKAYNRLFEQENIDGLAYRRKQHRFTSQFVDIMVDCNSEDIPDLVIEHKSYKTKSSSKLYFSQHFSSGTEDNFLDSTHQVERVREFAEITGYTPFLAVEVRRGPGKSIRLFIVPWARVVTEFRKWRDDEEDAIAGFSPSWMEGEGLEVERDEQQWKTLKETFDFEGNYL